MLSVSNESTRQLFSKQFGGSNEVYTVNENIEQYFTSNIQGDGFSSSGWAVREDLW